MIENVPELLDVPNEWFLASNNTLYYYPNSTESAALASSKFVASRLATLIAVNGSMSHAVKDVHISGLTLAHTKPTFMDKYEVPSAGDW